MIWLLIFVFVIVPAFLVFTLHRLSIERDRQDRVALQRVKECA